MAVRQHGDQNYKFGFSDASAATIASSVGLSPQEITTDFEPEFEAEAKNLYAETVAYTKGSPKGTFTLSGYVQDETLFKQTVKNGGGFLYGGDAYIIKGGKLTVKNTEFQMAELTGVTFPNITDTTGTALN